MEQAVAYFAEGYSCSQSLLMAYAELLSIQPAMAARIAAPFGGGMGHLGRTCGAVTGALMVLGAKHGHIEATDKETKERVYEMVRRFDGMFEARNGATACKDLVGYDLNTTEGLASAREEGIFNTLCPGFVRDAAEIVGEMLDAEGNVT